MLHQLVVTLLTLSFAGLALRVPITLASPAQAIHVCFTPGDNCTTQLINALSSAKKSILVQAYTLTSTAIAYSLIAAKKRGVDVEVILDKSQCTQKYSSARLLIKQHIPTWVDHKPAIAHNKIMIIDGEKVITGSFNFTRAAQERNAENLLIITDPILAQRYISNWQRRLKESILMSSFQTKKLPSINTDKKSYQFSANKGFINILQ